MGKLVDLMSKLLLLAAAGPPPVELQELGRQVAACTPLPPTRSICSVELRWHPSDAEERAAEQAERGQLAAALIERWRRAAPLGESEYKSKVVAEQQLASTQVVCTSKGPAGRHDQSLSFQPHDVAGMGPPA